MIPGEHAQDLALQRVTGAQDPRYILRVWVVSPRFPPWVDCYLTRRHQVGIYPGLVIKDPEGYLGVR